MSHSDYILALFILGYLAMGLVTFVAGLMIYAFRNTTTRNDYEYIFGIMGLLSFIWPLVWIGTLGYLIGTFITAIPKWIFFGSLNLRDRINNRKTNPADGRQYEQGVDDAR